MYKTIFILLIILFVPTNLTASYWLAHVKDEITFTTHMPDPYGTVKVAAKLTANRDKIECIKVAIHGKDIIFPAKAYSDIIHPDIGSMELHYNPADKSKLFLYLEYTSGMDDPEQCNVVRFVIKDDKLIGRRFDEIDKSTHRDRIIRNEDL